MPITQERFLQIVNGSAEIIDKIRQLYKMTDPISTSAIVNANAALAQLPDGQVAAALREFLAYMASIRSAIVESNVLSSDAAIAVQVERAHFQRHAKDNARAAEAQRRARVKKGATPRLVQQGLLHAGVSQDPNPPSITREFQLMREMGPTPRAMEDDPIFSKYHKDLLANWTKGRVDGQ